MLDVKPSLQVGEKSKLSAIVDCLSTDVRTASPPTIRSSHSVHTSNAITPNELLPVSRTARRNRDLLIRRVSASQSLRTYVFSSHCSPFASALLSLSAISSSIPLSGTSKCQLLSWSHKPAFPAFLRLPDL